MGLGYTNGTYHCDDMYATITSSGNEVKTYNVVCSKCQTTVTLNTKFCPQCGFQFSTRDDDIKSIREITDFPANWDLHTPKPQKCCNNCKHYDYGVCRKLEVNLRKYVNVVVKFKDCFDQEKTICDCFENIQELELSKWKKWCNKYERVFAPLLAIAIIFGVFLIPMTFMS